MIHPEFEAELVAGIIAHLAAADPATFIQPDEYGLDDDEPLVALIESHTPAFPERVLSVWWMNNAPLTPGIDFVESTIQLRARGYKGRPLSPSSILGAARVVLHEQDGLWGQVRVSACFAQGIGYLGPDGAGRYELTQTYLIRSSGQVLGDAT